jgi:hypothetical protein
VSNQVSKTAEKLRQAEAQLSAGMMSAVTERCFAPFRVALAAYSDALLAHHKAVEAEQTRLAGEFLLGGPEDPKRGDQREAKAD